MNPSPCFVCKAPTTRTTSMNCVGPPRDRSEAVHICPACASAWTASLMAAHAATRQANFGKKSPNQPGQ